MTDRDKIAEHAARLETLLAERLGARKGTLGQRARKLGRDLPRGVRRDLEVLGEAAHLAGHPVLGQRLDTERLARAAERAEAHLAAIDPAYRRRGRILGFLAVTVVNLGLLLGAMIALLRWRGLI